MSVQVTRWRLLTTKIRFNPGWLKWDILWTNRQWNKYFPLLITILLLLNIPLSLPNELCNRTNQVAQSILSLILHSTAFDCSRNKGSTFLRVWVFIGCNCTWISGFFITLEKIISHHTFTNYFHKTECIITFQHKSRPPKNVSFRQCFQ
jgi:hypothetical protein